MADYVKDDVEGGFCDMKNKPKDILDSDVGDKDFHTIQDAQVVSVAGPTLEIAERPRPETELDPGRRV